MLINVTINKTFDIHVFVKTYSCYNIFNQRDMNTFNILTFMQVRTDKNKFMQIRNIKTLNILTFIQILTHKNKLKQDKKQTDGNIFFHMICVKLLSL